MESALVIVFVGALVFLAHLFVTLFERTRVPDVLYLVLIGVVIGPVLGVVSPEDFGKVGHIFTSIALVVILFEGGLELNIEHLTTSLRGTLVLTVLSYVLAFAAITGALIGMQILTPGLAIFTGAVLAGPAPAIVIPLVRQLRLAPATQTRLMLESPLGEALCIIVALVILDSIRFEGVHVGHAAGRLLSSFVFAVVIGVAGGFFWSILLFRIRQLRHAIFTTPSFILILFGVTEFLGFSGAVAALTFGVTLGNVGTLEVPWLSRRYNLTPLQHNETEKAFFGEIVFLIKTFFFVYLGLSIRFTDVWILTLAALLSVVLLVTRLLAVRLSTRRAETMLSDALAMGVMIPRGTAAAVLASIPAQLLMEGADVVQNLIYSVVVVSIIGTGVLVSLIERRPGARVLGIAYAGYRISGNGSDPAADVTAGEERRPES